MSKNILVYGAGAIGRGYVPWLFKNTDTKLYFVETNKNLHSELIKDKKFTTYMTTKSGYESYECSIEECFFPGEEFSYSYDGVITAVGPRQIINIKDNLKKLKCPIIFFENDHTLPDKISRLTKSENFFFGIPDVITSNTAPEHLRKKSKLSIVTENGVAYAHISAKDVGGNINYVNSEQLNKQWLAKLYIHNTPHCIAAYLGSLCNFTFLHEGMNCDDIYNIVKDAMFEMVLSTEIVYKIERDFLEWYSNKELNRFSNKLLFDPISRVAREPFRKLGLTNRLVGAAQLCLRAGIKPKNIITGIMAAFLYDDINDNDSNIKILIESLKPVDFLKLIINIQPNEALYELIISNWGENMEILKGIKNGR
tara:strand:+ start:122 stop:1222 length:1101 start_codon:yes stop_codon:yes gene_type:complete